MVNKLLFVLKRSPPFSEVGNCQVPIQQVETLRLLSGLNFDRCGWLLSGFEILIISGFPIHWISETRFHFAQIASKIQHLSADFL